MGKAWRLAGTSTLMLAASAAAWNALRAWRRPSLAPPLDVDVQTLFTTDGTVAYYSRGHGPTVLLLHSFNAAGTAYELRPLFERLAMDHRVVAVDWPGFGLADRSPRWYTPDLYRRVLERMLDTLAAGPVDVVSLSLPSQYLALLAAAMPARFRRLVMISPTGLEPRGAGRPLRWLALATLRTPLAGDALFNLLTTRLLVTRYLRRLFARPVLLPAGYPDYAWATAQQPGARYAPASFLSGVLDAPDAAAAFRALPVETLLIYGDHPRVSDPDAARAAVAANPALSLTVINDSGDLPQWEQPETTARAVREFLLTGAGERRRHPVG